MDIDLQFLLPIILSLVSLFICCVYFLPLGKQNEDRKSCTAPEAGGSWPVIGHMHLLGGNQLPHKTLGAMADKYGPVFTIRLGSHRVLILSSSQIVKECFTVHDRVFSGRPCIAASKFLGYDNAMFGFAPYDSYWREMRKIVMVELLSNHRIDMLSHIRASEVKSAVRELWSLWSREGGEARGVLVDMKQWFGDLTHNIALRMVGGKRYFGPNADCEEGEAKRCRKVMRDFVYLFGVFVLSDAFPFLGRLDFQGYQKAMKRTGRELDRLVEAWLEEHKQTREGQVKEERDFMDVMLNINLQTSNLAGYSADTITKATCLNMVLAGGDTTMVTLTWALSLLMNNPCALRIAREEIDTHVGNNRLVEESDIKNLVYLQAVVKETFRLCPPAPIIGLRCATHDCMLSSGYHIPAGTRLMVNAWKIHRDQNLWPNPLEFQPERFVGDRDLIREQNCELIPFGSGRRACPGASLGLQVVILALASFLQGFEVALPEGVEQVDMTESTGLTNLKATPLEVLLTPRLAAHVYHL